MKKTYAAVVGTRGRITIPYDCWMDANLRGGLKLNLNGKTRNWIGTDAIVRKTMAYRVAQHAFEIGTKLTLVPQPGKHLIDVIAA